MTTRYLTTDKPKVRNDAMAYFKRVADKEAVFQPSPEIKQKSEMASGLQTTQRRPQRGYKPNNLPKSTALSAPVGDIDLLTAQPHY